MQSLRCNDLNETFLRASLLSAESLLSLGRIEQRAIFSKALVEVLSGDEALASKMWRIAGQMAAEGGGCVLSQLNADERYKVLRCCLNHLSSHFASMYFHFNTALDHEKSEFSNAWYCLTIVVGDRFVPVKKEEPGPLLRNQHNTPSIQAINFSDERFKPLTTLRLIMINEAELNAMADGHLEVGRGGFMTNTHKDRFQLLQDFAKIYRLQLAKTSITTPGPENPFTSERVHRSCNSNSHANASGEKKVAVSKMARTRSSPTVNLDFMTKLQKENQLESRRADAEKVYGECLNCFLRFHIPLRVESTSQVKQCTARSLGMIQTTPASGLHCNSAVGKTGSPAVARTFSLQENPTVTNNPVRRHSSEVIRIPEHRRLA